MDFPLILLVTFHPPGLSPDQLSESDGTATCNLQKCFPSDSMKPSHDGKNQRQSCNAYHHPVPHKRKSVKGNQPAENTCPSGQEDGQMEYEENSANVIHHTYDPSHGSTPA